MRRVLLFVFGVPLVLVSGAVAWFLADQWWRGLAQDDCTFGTVDNTRYREMYAEARRRRWERRDVLSTDGNALARDIDAIAPPASGLYNHIAATHAVMRAHGYILAHDWHEPMPRHFEVPFLCDPACSYFVTYVGSRVQGFWSIFILANRSTVYVDFPLNIRNASPCATDACNWSWTMLLAASGKTAVSLLTSNLKARSFDSLVSSDYFCPPIPPKLWEEEFNEALREQLIFSKKSRVNITP